jgi:hypothetical protein
MGGGYLTHLGWDDEEETVIVNVVEAAEERSPYCLTNKQEFLEWKEQKECE